MYFIILTKRGNPGPDTELLADDVLIILGGGNGVPPDVNPGSHLFARLRLRLRRGIRRVPGDDIPAESDELIKARQLL